MEPSSYGWVLNRSGKEPNSCGWPPNRKALSTNGRERSNSDLARKTSAMGPSSCGSAPNKIGRERHRSAPGHTTGSKTGDCC